MSTLAPIAIFAYNRPRHLRATLEALLQCPEFSGSKVFVFFDGPKTADDEVSAQMARNVVNELMLSNMTVLFRESNLGLASSIIDGVTKICDEYGQVIVIEDDLVVQPTTLSWLNAGLAKYAHDQRVMQISAYQYRIPEFAKRNDGSFQHFATTWGWATWKRAWDKFDAEARGWEALKEDSVLSFNFDAGGVYPFSDMLLKQMNGKLDSWGIRWSWSVFVSRGLTLMPPRSLVRNTGMDSSGTQNSVGFLKKFAGGAQPLLWKSTKSPTTPELVSLNAQDERAFRGGLIRSNAKRNARIKAALAHLGVSRFAN